MAIIETPTQATPTAEVDQIFESVKARVSFVPKTFEMLGTSPLALQHWWDFNQQVQRRGAFSPELLAHVRLLVAVHGEFPCCVEFNAISLKKTTGLTDEQLWQLFKRPENAKLPESEYALLLFVLKALAEPEEVSASEVENLRALGWKDADIFEAVYYGGYMQLLGQLFNAFRMHES